MPRISAARAKERHDTLLLAARKVFAAKGYEGAAISDIARAARISDGLLYHYFGSKRDLLFAVLQDFYERIIADLEAAVSRASGFDARLKALIRGHVSVFVSDVDLCRLFISEVRNLDEYLESDAHELNRRYTAVFLRIFSEGVKEGRVSREFDGRLVRDMLFGGIEHVAWRHVSADASLDVDRVVKQVLRLFLSGLAGETS
jgi:TetR/AcrR family fatty acid metabolism transcriptional regulator